MKAGHPEYQRGFALVLTLSIMSFVLLLLMTLVSLVQVESRSSQTQLKQLEAQQAALLGLNIAIGELQKTAGPDQRVTATAGIFGTTIKQPHLLGVWKSYKQANSNTGVIDYDSKKKHEDDGGDFVQWLSSMSDTQRTEFNTHRSDPSNPVEMLGKGSVSSSGGSNSTSVHSKASAIGFEGVNSLRNSGKFAWQVFDESQKVNLTLNQDAPENNAERMHQLGIAGKPGFQIDTVYAPLQDLDPEQKAKLASLYGLPAVSFDPVINKAFHYLTADSKHLLIDVAQGGYQKDLSLLFENATLPAPYNTRYLYGEHTSPVVAAPNRFAGAEPMPSPDPKWSLLHSHYKLYEQVTNSSGTFRLAASSLERGDGTGFFESQQILPVISNAQFIFSMAGQKSNNGDVTNGATYQGYLGLWTDVVLTLWNPYSVELNITDGMEVEFYRFPLEVQFYRKSATGWDSASSGQFVHLSHMFNQGNSQYGGGSVQDKLPYRARITTSFVLKPGEYKVFSPITMTYNHMNRNYNKGLELDEGFVAGGKGGGIFERYIAVDKNYQGLCRWPEMSHNAAQILVNPGDTIGVEVRSAKIDRNASFVETNNEEIVSYLKVFMGDAGANTSITSLSGFQNWLSERRTHIGGVEINMSDTDLNAKLPYNNVSNMTSFTLMSNEFPIQDSNNPDFWSYKTPFLIASLRLKTEQDSEILAGSPSGSLWLHNGPTNNYFTAGLKDDQSFSEKGYQYELTWEPMTSWNNIPTVEVDSGNRGYGGSGVTSATGVNYLPFLQVPLAPATSLAQFVHAPLNSSGQAPLTTQIVGNSFNSPLISLSKKSEAGTGNSNFTLLDHSYMANNTLFDGYFLSTASDERNAPLVATGARSLKTVLSEFFEGTESLANPNIIPAVQADPEITEADYASFAQHLYYRGGFNVNSISEEAWALFLASGTQESLPVLDLLSAQFLTAPVSIDPASGEALALSRFAPLVGAAHDPASIRGENGWAGHRRLTLAQVKELAKYVVEEVKARGPFQSVAEFVNRRLENNSATANSGALQSAIEKSSINTDFGQAAPKNNSELLGDEDDYTGNTSDGSLTQVIQSDLLNRLAPSLCARGDTFRIRAYGESNAGGQVVKVWCEAVVQRNHAYVDANEAPTTAVKDLNTINEAFGRRFKIVSVRWLTGDEV